MNEDDARKIFGSDANIEKLRPFKMNGGEVDFGDDLHLGGSPQGNAIVVWSIDGRVAIRGRLYSDTGFNEAQEAILEIQFRRTNGTFTRPTKLTIYSQGFLQSKLVQKISPVGNFNQVSLELKRFVVTDLGSVTHSLIKRTFNR
jgi:hypothetical protein